VKRARRSRSEVAGAPRAKPFHAPFEDALAARLRAERAAPKAKPPNDAERTDAGPSRPREEARPDDETLFREAMMGVDPLPASARAEPPPRPIPEGPRAWDDEAEALAHLADLCAGQGPFSLEDTAEYVEGAAPGVDRRIVRKLRRGELSVQAHLDLHGMTRDEAHHALERFVLGARARGLRCVLVVHGRGLNSKDHIAVLKLSVAAWLQRGRIGRAVLAYATARPHDGGAGAVYVLLRK
jgi:DNA-nicking Smr family endonuclease